MNVRTPQELGILARLERQKRGWTQADLASRIGVRPLWISQFERGKPTAQVGLVLRTLYALNLSLSLAGPEPRKAAGKGIDLDELVRPDSVESDDPSTHSRP